MYLEMWEAIVRGLSRHSQRHAETHLLGDTVLSIRRYLIPALYVA